MEKKINVAELLENCPNGMELDCTMFDNAKFIGVENYDKPICIRIGNGDLYFHLTKFGTWNFDDNAKCLIYPKGKTTWEGFVPPCKFKDGDILYIKTDSHNHIEFIIIFKEIRNNHIYTHACFAYQNLSIDKCAVCHIADAEIMRLATEEEKEKLFNAIKDNGYKWNEESKSLEKLPKFKVGDRIKYIYFDRKVAKVVKIHDKRYELDNGKFLEFQDENAYEISCDKFDITTLKPFDKVLIRSNSGKKWTIDFFGVIDNYNKYPFTCLRHSVTQCIPYEGNQHLLNTTDDCDEYYKTWK
jgi:hypothetical protein